MNKKNFTHLINRKVELFLDPNVPKTSGTLYKCEDDYLIVGEEIWSYKAILGIRPLNSQNEKISDYPDESVAQVKEIKELKSTEEKIEKIEKIEQSEEKYEYSQNASESKIQVLHELKIPDDKEFTGVIVSFFYERGNWGFISSDEVKKLGVPLRDGENVFVHLNQIVDDDLRKKLLENKLSNPNINVVFKLKENQNGIAADDVREIVTETQDNVKDDKSQEITAQDNSEKSSVKVIQEEIPQFFDEGEIEYFRRYDEIPHGEIRVKGNKLFRFDEADVIDPLLAVFLECSPSAEGQPVKFVKTMNSKGRMRATHVKSSVPFPEDKIKDWKKSGLLKKAEERIEALAS